MVRVWFTSDLHLNHSMLVQKGHRPFANVEVMNNTLINNWNDVVRTEDTVWVLGDVGMGSTQQFLPMVPRLNGTKHLIAGNHDGCWSGHRFAHKALPEWLRFFETVQSFARRRINGQSVLLSHFPYAGAGDHTSTERYAEYRLHDTGLWLLHGHVHAEWRVRGRMINVGVDVNSFTPVSLEWIAALIGKGAGDEQQADPSDLHS
jgi:calcineurin-like phosphoesterase family protein